MTITDRVVGLLVGVRQAMSRWAGRVNRASTRGHAAAEGDDPVLAFLAQAPVDDEVATADDERAIVEGWAAHRRGESVSAADAKRQTLADARPERVVPV